MEELILGEVWAGFPSPGENWRERSLKIGELLVANPDTTHYFRVKGSSMQGAGIVEGDVVVVDRAEDATSGDIVVAAHRGRFLIKRLEYVGEQGSQMLLCSASPDIAPILVTPEMGAEIWGVVVAVVHRMRKRSPGHKDEQR